ncbi:hypothetical protein AMR42_11270 [Limnothrix sp. PR1529]|nr:hypothetical protein BCR12_17565 [Limnothrix sp. P13C2]PIB09988.1 hypothetical protein AMR42_11270 [Limnothrix sp. PR1529]
MALVWVAVLGGFGVACRSLLADFRGLTNFRGWFMAGVCFRLPICFRLLVLVGLIWLTDSVCL